MNKLTNAGLSAVIDAVFALTAFTSVDAQENSVDYDAQEAYSSAAVEQS